MMGCRITRGKTSSFKPLCYLFSIFWPVGVSSRLFSPFFQIPVVPLPFHTAWVCSHRYFWKPWRQCCGCGGGFWGLCWVSLIFTSSLRSDQVCTEGYSYSGKRILDFFFFFSQHLRHFSAPVARRTERDGANFPKLKIQTVMEIHRKKSIERFLLALYQIQKLLLFLSCRLSSFLPARESGVKEFNIKPGGLTDFGGERGR